jgi:predicted RNase H-like HicB family nuclease
VKTYNFKVVVEPDGNQWHAYCPALQKYGAATWGKTEAEAYRHIQEVVQMVIAELLEDGDPIPDAPDSDVVVYSEPRVMITV